MKRTITTKNNEKWVLIKNGTYTMVDTGKKVFKLPFNVDMTINFLYKMRFVKQILNWTLASE